MMFFLVFKIILFITLYHYIERGILSELLGRDCQKIKTYYFLTLNSIKNGK